MHAQKASRHYFLFADIANDLEEYLAHLNRTAFSFDGGPNLDFAEAALLIQSSACVYSKKVEYLHNLAYQALETVRCKKRPADGVEGGPEEGQEGGGPAQRGRNNDGDEDDSLEAFLTAGQDLKEAESKDLNLAREEDDSGAPGYVRAPAALLALEDQGGGGGDGDAGFYRLAQCHVHISGALFLDAMEADAYDAFLNSTGTGGAHAGVQAAMQQQLAGTSGQGGANATQNGNGDDDDDDDGGGGMGGDDDDDEVGLWKGRFHSRYGWW
ncbi:hypothetical protein DUNSADRAFT_16939 [Dunaliella salina]|uniref:Condensin II complex subunit H2 N-terminal domain-containing protein n=1 Tax=Dunaliella salina TaxID=3046 RepID=A0ABQ7H0M1_DUNSA|nr:hypothetical protein DUNSADRAFT_16939 [Dunaliella salina]|eukprot:KAF5840391.1 hypothetical protein DUNSADRAFT_16939 [Dunaliella salina]